MTGMHLQRNERKTECHHPEDPEEDRHDQAEGANDDQEGLEEDAPVEDGPQAGADHRPSASSPADRGRGKRKRGGY